MLTLDLLNDSVWSKTASAVLKATAEAVALQFFSILLCRGVSGIGWVAGFSQPTLLGINVGLTIEPLAQPTVTSLVIRFISK